MCSILMVHPDKCSIHRRLSVFAECNSRAFVLSHSRDLPERNAAECGRTLALCPLPVRPTNNHRQPAARANASCRVQWLLPQPLNRPPAPACELFAPPPRTVFVCLEFAWPLDWQSSFFRSRMASTFTTHRQKTLTNSYRFRF